MPIQLHTFLVTLHLVALSIGFGSALIADWVVVSGMVFGTVPPRAADRLALLSRTIACGLATLWITGAILVAFQFETAPAQLLANRKLLAKLLIVAALTVDAVLIHRFALPRVRSRVGRPLFDDRVSDRLLPTLLAAVSLGSWLFALVLGEARELNATATVGGVLSAYVPAVLALWSGALALTAAPRHRARTRSDGPAAAETRRLGDVASPEPAGVAP